MVGHYERRGLAHALLALVGGVLLLGVGPAVSHAASAFVTRDEGKPTLSKLETGGWAVKLGFTNVTSGVVHLRIGSVRPVVTGSCTVQFATGPTVTLQAAQDESVTVTYSKYCTVGKDGATLSLTTDTKPPQSLKAAVGPPTDPPQPDWGVLWAFAIALVVVLIALLIMLLTNMRMTLNTRLDHLPTTWRFKESWATNVTAGGGILAGVVGSTEVVKAFLGTEPDAAIALAIVGAAVAAGFLAFGALLVQTIKYTDSESPTAGGFVLGASCTLAGAFGELVTMYETGKRLDLGGWQHWLLPIVLLIGIVLALYAFISVRATLEIGTAKKSAIPLSESTVAAAYLASKCCDGIGDPDEVLHRIEARLSPKVKVATNAKRGKLWTGKDEQREPAPTKRVGAALL